MKYIVKDKTGKTVLQTIVKANAEARLAKHPAYKLITIPEAR